ncbi:hypothetical protein [Leucobacter tenebrionis]|uniref:hypothetical protein n=1 Tax=Leucobacter tenebrionis TaxID=2873270 RepID=UPI001CA6A37E|nr:hypothetical protein [Leucobacter tenebrionis]QZY52069.1 hypothetical protein KVY00_00870 [Leucobacter tenebrionis]
MTARTLSITRSTMGLLVTCSVAVAAAAAITAVAAWRRNRIWLSFGSLNGALLVGSLILVDLFGTTGLAEAAQRVREAGDPVRLVTPENGTRVESLGDPPPPPAFTWAEAESEARALVAAVVEQTEEPLIVVDRNTTHRTAYDPAAALPRIACTPASEGGPGEQLALVIELQSDDGGLTKQRILDAWRVLGYPETGTMRSESFAGHEEDSPLRYLSVNDRYTIDGTLTVRIESRCL